MSAERATAPPAGRRGRSALALVLVLAAAAWLHAGSLSAPFFADDYLFLDQARGRSLLATLASPDPIGNFFRPVSRQLWFWSLAAASDASPRAFHVANLLLLIAIVALLFRIARRLLPLPAAVAAAALLAVHHAADVPVMWASGSQDLLAVLGALAAIELHAAGRRGWASLALALALLSKETVALAPLAAVAVARRPGASWRDALRRGWPLFAILAAWAAAWLGASHGARTTLAANPEPWGIPAALAHLAQTAAGVEWPPGGIGAALRAAPPPALLLALAGVALAAVGAPRASGARRHALVAGAIWAVVGALPVAAVAGIWSAYYYLFSLCGVALVVGALVTPLPPWIGMLPVLVVGVASGNARRLPEFATVHGPWTTQSHLNRHYVARGMTLAERCLADLKRARPELPRSSTLYFAGIPPAIAFQAADGPLIRWAYRDTSLRSHFLSGFRLEQAERGPAYFFQMENDTLVEVTGDDSLLYIGLGLIINDAPGPAGDILALASRRDPEVAAYWAAWTHGARGDRAGMTSWLERAGVSPDAGPAPQVPRAILRVAAGDTAGAIALMQEGVWRHGLDAGAHALMADLLLTTGDMNRGAIEAFAARTLAPDEPSVWRRWGMVEAVRHANGPAERALERYLALVGPAGRADAEVQEALRTIRRRLPGGDLARAELGRLER